MKKIIPDGKSMCGKRSRRRLETAARTLLSGIGLCQSLTVLADEVPAPAPATVQMAPAIELPPELRAAGKWGAFKALWRKLGELPSPESAGVPVLNPQQVHDFRQALVAIVAPGTESWQCWPWGKEDEAPSEGAQRPAWAFSLHKRLRPCHENARNVAVSIETRMLVKLLELRIENMKGGPRFPRGPIHTRMMPKFGEVPPSKWMFERLDRIESRLDALETVRAGGNLDPAVADAALQGLAADANFVLQLDALVETPFLLDMNLKAADFSPLADKDQPDGRYWEIAAETCIRRQAIPGQFSPPMAKGEPEASLLSLKAWLAEMRAAHERILPLLGELER